MGVQGRYFCCWGRGCERLHDIIDLEFVKTWTGPTDESVVMTTWHDDESPDDALWFFLFNAFPADDYLDGCGAALALLIGDEPARVERARFALAHPREFSRLVLAAEGERES